VAFADATKRSGKFERGSKRPCPCEVAYDPFNPRINGGVPITGGIPPVSGVALGDAPALASGVVIETALDQHTTPASGSFPPAAVIVHDLQVMDRTWGVNFDPAQK
jgi:hypothetical protein